MTIDLAALHAIVPRIPWSNSSFFIYDRRKNVAYYLVSGGIRENEIDESLIYVTFLFFTFLISIMISVDKDLSFYLIWLPYRLYKHVTACMIYIFYYTFTIMISLFLISYSFVFLVLHWQRDAANFLACRNDRVHP